MIPATGSQPPASKRKAHEDGNPLLNAGKKKKDTSKNKRKLNGEEQPGGLVIVRAPSAPPWTTQQNGHTETAPSQSLPPRASSRPPSSQRQNPHPPDHSKQPSKKFKADGSTTTARQLSKGKDRELQPSTRAEPEVDEDVRQMQSEADILRRKSQAAEHSVGTLNEGFEFPPPRPSRQQTPRVREASLPILQQETPQIERNRFMRGEPSSSHRRKRSLSRGKRFSSSFENTGIISQPHTSVADSSFHKHIDGELPEPARARQLLIWCSHRAMNTPTDSAQGSSSKRRESKKSGKDPPPLSDEATALLKRVQEGVIRMLADKKIDTNVYSAEDDREPSRPKKENEQNVKNRAREIRFNAHIQRSKAEEDAWLEVSHQYNTYRAEMLAELEKQSLAKAKGKQRASADEIDEWEVDERALSEHFRRSGSLDLARKVVGPEGGKSPLGGRLQDLEYTVDHLHTLAHSALETTHIAEFDLNRRFALLNISLSTRAQPAPSSVPHNPGALSSYLPPSLTRLPPTTDPQDLLRALSRIDAERPQNQVGDAARRAAREVQRAADAPIGMSERRLTGVPPPTPRKPPGTPRRATTPGRGR